MDKTWKAEWIAWLRDPAHQQVRGVLKMGNAYCCLGGACEISGLSSFEPIGDGSRERRGWRTSDAYLDRVDILPVEVAELFSLPTTSPCVRLADLTPKTRRAVRSFIPGCVAPKFVWLVSLNDHGAPFSLIADVIEQGL